VAPALVAPILGWVVDRFRRRPFLITVILATVAILLPLLLVRERDQLWLIYAVAVGYGATMLLTFGRAAGPHQGTAARGAAGRGERGAADRTPGSRLVAPLGGAALFTIVGIKAVIGINVACLLIGAATLFALKVRETAPAPPEMHWLREGGSGSEAPVRPAGPAPATIGFVMAVAVIGLTETLVFAYVDQGLHRPPAFVSVLVCVQGVGGLTGGLLAARVVRRLGEVGAAAIGVLLFAIGFGLFAFPNIWLGFACAVIAGAGSRSRSSRSTR
jgi:predicted MFS family arabinose efflux permease